MNRRFLKVIIFFIDFLILQLSLCMTLILRYGISELLFQWGRHFSIFSMISIIWFIVFYIADLYNITQPLNYKYFLLCMTINIGLAISFFYISPGISISPKTNLGLVAVFFVVLFICWRNIIEHFLDRIGIQKFLVIIGVDKYSLEIAEKIMCNHRLGYTLSGFVVGEKDSVYNKIPEWLKRSSVFLMSSMDELSDYLEKQEIHSIVVSETWYKDIHQHLYRFFPKGVRMYQLTTFWELIEETIPVNATDDLWFLQNMSRGPYSVYHKLKRFFDLFVALIFLPLIMFFCLLTAFLVIITSRGPVIYKQIRVGLGNKNFTIYKFRSMRVDAEKNGAVWASTKDPRLTVVGDFIRRFRLDELPQIFNIIKGDMSFIGPRPERPEFVKHLVRDIPHYNLRHLIKPGLSGWAQVKYRYGASKEDSVVKLMYDLFYVKNVSPILDVRIALKTVLTILTKSGR